MTQPALATHVKGRGRHYEHPYTGELLPSVTNVIDVLGKPAIPRWAAKSVAETAYRMRHSLAEMEEPEAVDMLKASPWQKSGRAADRGSSIHDWLEAKARGLPEPELSADAEPYRPSAQSFLETWNPHFHATEATIFGDGYGGTTDWIATIGDSVILGDYKSNEKDRVFPEVALQLAALRHGSFIAYPDGTTEPMPDIDQCWAVCITPHTASVYPVETGARSYDAFMAALTLWHWRNESPIYDRLEVVAS